MTTAKTLARLFLGCALIANVGDLAAEPTVTVSGEVRAREELRHEIFSPASPTGEDSYDEAHLRTRLRVDGTVNEQLSATIELQDVRILGSEGSTTADTEGVDLKRGYFLVEPRQTDLSIKVGRWVMAYGDQRLIGHLEWVDQGRSYDGVQVSYKPARSFVDVFAVRVRETLEVKDDLHFGGIYGGFFLGNSTDLELYVLGLRDAMAPNSNFATIGSRIAHKRNAVDASAEVAMQIGTLDGDDHLAFAAAAKGSYAINPERALKVSGEFAFASGDSDPADGESETFQTLFPTNHIYYGLVDLAALENIVMVQAGVSVKPSPATSASLNLHHFRLADPAGGWFNAGGALVRPGDADASSELGNELDLVAGWTAVPGLSLQAGLGIFFGGAFVDDTGGGGDAIFAYGMGTAKF